MGFDKHAAGGLSCAAVSGADAKTPVETDSGAAPIGGLTPLPVLLRMLSRHRVAPRYRHRARRRLLMSAALEPLRWYEKLRYRRLLASTEIHPEPIFLLGYGRSGTTHLHNLLWHDRRFGVVTNYQAALQPIALTGQGRLERRLAAVMPSRRPMDNVAVTADSPQEEEIALMNSSEHTPLRFMDFPQALPALYDRYLTELGSDPAVLEAWKRDYLDVLRKATVLGGGRRLVLKTPPHTARVPVLLELFPHARFIHIVRNPYDVYRSMRNMYRKILPPQVLQEFDWQTIDDWTLSAYRTTVARYLETRSMIPDGRLFEIRYEDLDSDPLAMLARLYTALDLPDFAEARPELERYLAELGSFEKNRFDLSAETVETVNEHWGLSFDAFGYERLDPREVAAQAEPDGAGSTV